MVNHNICKTCGVQFAATNGFPERCPICEDERQYVGWEGQQWTTMEDLQKTHHNMVRRVSADLVGIGTQPVFAIGQRALLVQTPQGNVLWDCISLIDEPTIALVNSLGGISAIAISHPHFYSAMAAWSQAFDAPVYLHADDRQWVMRPHESIVYWEGETKTLLEGLTLVRCGGHFPGSAVLHWAAGAQGKGALLSSDTLTVASDRRYVSFMYSYPNLIPLPSAAVRKIVAAVAQFEFDRIYGGWWGRIVESNAKQDVAQSASRYIAALEKDITSNGSP